MSELTELRSLLVNQSNQTIHEIVIIRFQMFAVAVQFAANVMA
jgi:hypothetical protein